MVMNLETLQGKLEAAQSQINFAQEVKKVLAKKEGLITLEDFLRGCLQVRADGPSEIWEVAECFGFHDTTEIKFAMFAAVSAGWAEFNDQWQFASPKRRK